MAPAGDSMARAGKVGGPGGKVACRAGNRVAGRQAAAGIHEERRRGRENCRRGGKPPAWRESLGLEGRAARHRSRGDGATATPACGRGSRRPAGMFVAPIAAIAVPRSRSAARPGRPPARSRTGASRPAQPRLGLKIGGPGRTARDPAEDSALRASSRRFGESIERARQARAGHGAGPRREAVVSRAPPSGGALPRIRQEPGEQRHHRLRLLKCARTSRSAPSSGTPPAARTGGSRAGIGDRAPGRTGRRGSASASRAPGAEGGSPRPR